MWHNDNDEIMKLYDNIENHENDSAFPATCPICGTVIEITDANGTVFEYDLSAYVM